MASCLQEAFQQYQALLEQASAGIGIVQRRKFVFVNTAFLTLLDKQEEDILDTFVETIFAGGRIPAEWQIRQGKDEQWVACKKTSIIWNEKPAILVTVQDITQQKRYEADMEHERRRLHAENIRLREAMSERHRFGRMIGKSFPMQQLYEQIPHTAASDATVMLCGETGTGKGLLARTIHEHSRRKTHPLRARKEDIPLLIEYFLQQEGACAHVPEQLHDQFLRHSWPGNVRELKNAIVRFSTFHAVPLKNPLHAFSQHHRADSSFQENLEAYERFLIEMALAQAGGHRKHAAHVLGIPLRTFYRKLKQRGIH